MKLRRRDGQEHLVQGIVSLCTGRKSAAFAQTILSDSFLV